MKGQNVIWSFDSVVCLEMLWKIALIGGHFIRNSLICDIWLEKSSTHSFGFPISATQILRRREIFSAAGRVLSPSVAQSLDQLATVCTNIAQILNKLCTNRATRDIFGASFVSICSTLVGSVSQEKELARKLHTTCFQDIHQHQHQH